MHGKIEKNRFSNMKKLIYSHSGHTVWGGVEETETFQICRVTFVIPNRLDFPKYLDSTRSK